MSVAFPLKNVSMSLFWHYRTEMRVARQLAIIADDVDARYSNEFNKMVRQLHVDQNTAYEAFATVARQWVYISNGCLQAGRQALSIYIQTHIRWTVSSWVGLSDSVRLFIMHISLSLSI